MVHLAWISDKEDHSEERGYRDFGPRHSALGSISRYRPAICLEHFSDNVTIFSVCFYPSVRECAHKVHPFERDSDEDADHQIFESSKSSNKQVNSLALCKQIEKMASRRRNALSRARGIIWVLWWLAIEIQEVGWHSRLLSGMQIVNLYLSSW